MTKDIILAIMKSDINLINVSAEETKHFKG